MDIGPAMRSNLSHRLLWYGFVGTKLCILELTLTDRSSNETSVFGIVTAAT